MSDLPLKWKKSEKSLRAVQLVFEFGKGLNEVIRRQATQQGLSPSDKIREIIGLEVKKPKRPRLTVSLSEEDYTALAHKYHLNPVDKEAIRQAIKDELIHYSQQQDTYTTL